VLPRTIGIVTSATGAAVQDILRILSRRHEKVRVVIYPAKVQGEGAAQEIAAGISFLNTLSDVDVMIVGRGGGSIEDLWAFNEEVVARAIFSSRIPVISAVGHEIDFTIADFVADLRAPTPSVAAELVVQKTSEFTDRIASLGQRLSHSLQFQISHLRNRILELSTDKVFASIEGKLRLRQQHLDELFFRLENAEELRISNLKNQWRLLSTSLRRFDLARRIELKREALHIRWERAQAHVHFLLQRGKAKTSALAGALNALSPQAVLERGYAICYDAEGNVLKQAESVNVGDLLSITLARGTIEGKAEKIIPPGRGAFNFAPALEEAHDKDHGF
jgi:exodeoxyribonuclease VII large subunit